MKLFQLNTHHTYLNIFPVVNILSTCVMELVYEDGTKQSRGIYTAGYSTKLKELKPGKILVRAQSLNSEQNIVREETIIIEDAIKYGGGIAKKGFVFENSPWVFITSGDRLYIWNRETRKSKIEYYLSPDTILPCKNVFASCKFFVFKTHSDYSIFDVEAGQIVFSYTNHIYANDRMVVYGVSGDIHVYDYIRKQEILCVKGQYSIGNRLFYVEDDQLKAISLSNGYKNIVPDIEYLNGKNYRLVSTTLLVLTKDGFVKEYHLYRLNNGEKGIQCFRFYSDYYISHFMGYDMPGYSKAEEQLEAAKVALQQIKPDLREVHLSAAIKLFDIENCKIIYIDGKRAFELSLIEVTRSIPRNVTKRYMRAIIKDEKCDSLSSIAAEYERTENDAVVEDKFIPNEKYGKYICSSEDKKWAVYQSEDGLSLYSTQDDKATPILQDVYMPCLYQNAYFSSDGKSVVMVKGKSSTICNFENLSETTFPVEGFVIDRQDGFNGYRPELDFVMSTLAQPRWRDSISLNYVRPEDMSGHIFRSPLGDYEAKTDYKLVRINRLTGKEITSEEFNELASKYSFKDNSTDEERKVIEKRRQELLEQYGEEKILSKCKDFWLRNFNRDHRDLTAEQQKPRIEEILKRELDSFLHRYQRITPWITDALGYVVYCNTKTHKESTILIGNNVWFLNYVSFSRDSRYLAFGAKMAQSDFRSSQSGVYVLFDLKEEKEILRYDEDRCAAEKQQLSAVWSAVFSSKMDSAFYDSNPNSYIVHYSEGHFSTECVGDRSLLCFSPSGDYIAFSNQRYIDYQHHPDHWGHQPSGNIFIHKVDDAQKTLLEFNDFSEGIKGVCRRAGNVASAAFSRDESRLLAVGSDGSVVVRNLHLQEEK